MQSQDTQLESTINFNMNTTKDLENAEKGVSIEISRKMLYFLIALALISCSLCILIGYFIGAGNNSDNGSKDCTTVTNTIYLNSTMDCEDCEECDDCTNSDFEYVTFDFAF